MTQDDQILVTTNQGQVYAVQRHNNSIFTPCFSLVRSLDLTSQGLSLLQPNEILLTAMYDVQGNIWSTTGGILGIGDPAQPSTTLGYITSANVFHTIHIRGQMVENGIAVSRHTIYVITGPSGASDHPNATGYMFAYQASLNPGNGSDTRVKTLYTDPYPAGSSLKPGGFARGSGSTPTLLGDKYVAVTDNADHQISLMIYRQHPSPSEPLSSAKSPSSSPERQPAMSTLFGHANGKGGYSAIVLNDYNAPPVYFGQGDINGPFNNVTRMGKGTVRVDVNEDGADCHVAWENPIRITSVPVLSTATGLLYGYAQDVELATRGEYVWYVTAMNWTTGVTEWEVRTGAGGAFNDNAAGSVLGKDGTLYQGVVGEIHTVKDVEAGYKVGK